MGGGGQVELMSGNLEPGKVVPCRYIKRHTDISFSFPLPFKKNSIVFPFQNGDRNIYVGDILLSPSEFGADRAIPNIFKTFCK